MKILACADIHGNRGAIERLKRLSKNVDLVLCAGDISEMENNISQIMSDLDSFTAPVLLIHGNHEDEYGLMELSTQYPNVTFIHKAAHHIGDYVFLGYGGGGFTKKDREFYEISEKFFRREINGKKRIILMTHAPPHNTILDNIGGSHSGNESIRSFIENFAPHLVICGHIHETAGKKQKLGRSLVLNPGKDGVIVNI